MPRESTVRLRPPARKPLLAGLAPLAGLAAVAGLAALAGCGDGDPAGPRRGETIEVEVFDFGYRPAAVDARVGDRIRFRQTGEVLHTVTSGEPGSPGAGGLFDGVVEESGDTLEVALSNPGTIPYFCRPHPFMTGGIEVSP